MLSKEGLGVKPNEIEQGAAAGIEKLMRERGLDRAAAASAYLRSNPEHHRLLMASRNAGANLPGGLFSDGRQLEGDVYRRALAPKEPRQGDARPTERRASTLEAELARRVDGYRACFPHATAAEARAHVVAALPHLRTGA